MDPGWRGLLPRRFLYAMRKCRGRIHVLEEMKLPGGACDGIKDEQLGFITAAAVKWKTILNACGILFRSIPSLETEGVSVLDEYYWLNKRDPNYSLMRATVKTGGEDAHTDGKFALPTMRR